MFSSYVFFVCLQAIFSPSTMCAYFALSHFTPLLVLVFPATSMILTVVLMTRSAGIDTV